MNAERRVGFPRLLATAAGAFLLAIPTAAAPAAAEDRKCRGERSQPDDATPKQLERATLCAINRERRKRDVVPLDRHRELNRAAHRHSKTMVRTNCFDHVCPGEPKLGERLSEYLGDAAGGIGEIIANGVGDSGSPRAVVRAWMRDSANRRNLLSPKFEHVGIGAVAGRPGRASGATYTVDFGYIRD